ncbi:MULTISPECIES: 7-carboxy-7-deazaguanine synthase [Rhodococcus]|uniref:7-carboxy-7-deazaguanine synthase n=1 Tax=Rhodococcus oxybenzonivorans TaxID=1990687 RepID=A0AAE4V1E3_9NOCA|nr:MULTISPECIES: 7-carboxy-7-deazaguanine synthase [Rhodococcus]MDV7245313.1 7-carboxy-7-deazaguanine synthase [Rhodococcus oxybenzonivorans]MDV7266114.1 7-carboxy-7-deazaguanine synthase [Rhodococcus oxybenzonivorans]MDV7272407.1 7-carboxy-7-deazaguanine synthase [Rhodococcus oxybenzonivorans]MDV7336338.1 7-carboxy-7-deazaguanine synthase [Rhodococcus oxybenzonivorans]MDV7347638.1 7-carboxy-7-deazaguanine synthase [Rhodococcus oxybenzonivorans]
MSYKVKEIFYTLQGEGMHAGRPAVFCRFTSCNLWTGRESDRHRAICKFCDTDFVGTDGPGGGKFATASDLASAIADKWPSSDTDHRMVVCTGGEPLLQLDEPLTTALHERGFYIAVETNGTQTPPPGVDWLCVSPKQGAELIVESGDELKLVFPQVGSDPRLYESLAFKSFRLQPMDGDEVAANTASAVEYCMTHPKWQLSLQTHKFLGIP